MPATATQSPTLLLDRTRGELAEWLGGRGHPTYRADQIRRWVFRHRVVDFETMHDLPERLRTELAESFLLLGSQVTRRQTARDGTEKLLLQFADGSQAECVLMREPRRRTVCISTQVGCAMGCVFCASGLLGLQRNLSTGEILEQVLRLDRLLSADERITNVVVMGIGEPLANLKALLPAVDALSAPSGMGLGARRITISTVGLPDRMRQLAAHGCAYNLAVSLHAPNDTLRNQLVPVNDNIGVRNIVEAAGQYAEQTGRRVTYEYVLLKEINDRPEHAHQLAGLLHGRGAHVNLIPMNAVSELPYDDPGPERTRRFARLLEQSGINATVRKRKGADIDAACGQLRRKAGAGQPVNS